MPVRPKKKVPPIRKDDHHFSMLPASKGCTPFPDEPLRTWTLYWRTPSMAETIQEWFFWVQEPQMGTLNPKSTGFGRWFPWWIWYGHKFGFHAKIIWAVVPHVWYLSHAVPHNVPSYWWCIYIYCIVTAVVVTGNRGSHTKFVWGIALPMELHTPTGEKSHTSNFRYWNADDFLIKVWHGKFWKWYNPMRTQVAPSSKTCVLAYV